MQKNIRIAVLIVLDALCVNISFIAALLIRFDFDPDNLSFGVFLPVYVANIAALTLIKLGVYWLAGIYKSIWRYAGSEELFRITVSCILATALWLSYISATQQNFPRSVYFISTLIDIALIGGSRFTYRTLRNVKTPGMFNIRSEVKTADSRIMLVGAGDAGASMIKELRIHPQDSRRVIVAVDDNPQKIGQRIMGIKIAGNRTDIPRLVKKYRIDEIIIAIPSASGHQLREIVEICHKSKCMVKIVPSLIDLINGRVSISTLRNVDIEDLLGREPVTVNLREVSGYLDGKIVMVTGGGGSIGSELCRQVARFKPRRIVIVDIYENCCFELQQEMKIKFPELEFDVAIASVRDRDRMEEIFRKYKPHVIFHAAAHKHVPLMEDCPAEAICNNVLGTGLVMDLAEKYLASRFILISTDKAVNPSSVMGATKRICEMLLQEKAASGISKTDFVAVRFGNVLGSNGSVIPTFRKQIAAGGPVTVTHPEITRYFMTIPEASQLVIQAGAMAKGGEIFILDMGEPVKIVNLAENLIRLSGFIPYEDIDIKFTGLRPGEKLYEELLLSEEGIKETSHDKIFIGHPVPASEGLRALLYSDNANALEESINALAGKSPAEVRSWIKQMVPNYLGA